MIVWFTLMPNKTVSDRFGRILNVYSFKPEVTATAYNSKSGNATIIWLSGVDGRPPEFGEIWRVWSFRHGVTATVYDSPAAGASIIWLSGADDEESPHKKTSS